MSTTVRKLVSTSTSLVITAADEFDIVEARGQSTPIVFTLPALSTVPFGKSYVLRDAGAAGAFPISIVGTLGELINGSASASIKINYGSIEVFSRGSSWGISSVSNPDRVVPSLPVLGKVNFSEVSTAGNATHSASAMVGGAIARDPNGGSRVDVTASAADIVAAIPGATAGTTFRLIVVNEDEGADTVTINAGAGVQVSGNAVVSPGQPREFLVVIDSVVPSAEAAFFTSVSSS